MRGWQKLKAIAAAMVLVGTIMPATALGGGRLLWTGGVSTVEGANGGGLVPWALIGGLGTADETGATFYATGLSTARFSLRSAGAAIGWHDRLEVSLARQWFDGRGSLSAVSLGQAVAGIKLRVAGDAVFDQDRWLPQLAVGALYKSTQDFGGLPRTIGAGHSTGWDVYVAATKVFLGGFVGHNALLDVTLTRSEANQLGVLGFGGSVGATWRAAGTVAVWLADRVLLGGEYRAKRGALATPVEGDAHDLFLAFAPSKHLSIVVAYVDLGPVAGQGIERGPSLSVSGTF